jgi:hypothetical protein
MSVSPVYFFRLWLRQAPLLACAPVDLVQNHDDNWNNLKLLFGFVNFFTADNVFVIK